MLRKRLENALWGAFIGDALGMPSHWYYSAEELESDFPEGIEWYREPPHPHPSSFLVGARYQPDTASAGALGRPYDILQEHARFYRTSYSEFGFATDAREVSHGNATARTPERYHYHHGLRAGENTLGADLIRVLMRSVSKHGGYSQQGFIDDFIGFMTSPGMIRDPYRETYVRKWFEAYSSGTDPENCAEHQRHRWSIASHGGMVRPLALALLNADNQPLATGMAVTHQQLTHRSELVSAGLALFIPMLLRLVNGESFPAVLNDMAPLIRRPQITGEELGRLYREAQGPGNIEHERMWRMHMAYDGMARELLDAAPVSESQTLPGPYARACYPEHGIPLLLRIAHAHEADLYQSLCANAGIGGDSVHRGMILGMLLGATQGVDDRLKAGLVEHDAIASEIGAFVSVALSGTGHLVV